MTRNASISTCLLLCIWVDNRVKIKIYVQHWTRCENSEKILNKCKDAGFLFLEARLVDIEKYSYICGVSNDIH